MASPRRGERVLDLVDAMDRLRSPGGCPWDAQQTHASLAPYAVEEAHELAEAIADGDRADLVEELGDLLLQVAFHARVGQEGEDPFDIDDVAVAIVTKLHRRHPHVFGDETLSDAAAVEARWEQLKAAEKPTRTSVLDGIPASLPALQRATKVATRLERTDRAVPVVDGVDPDVAALWDAAQRLRARGIDAEQALGAHVRALGRAADAG